MMFAFSRDRAVPGHQLWRRVAPNRVPRGSVFGIVCLRGRPDDPGASGTTSSATAVGTGDRGDRPVHRVHPARATSAGGWVTRGTSRGAWSLGKHYKWIDPIAIVWVVLDHASCSSDPAVHGRRCRGRTTSPGSSRTTRRSSWFGGDRHASSVAGGCISAKNWFKGPVRMGTEEELERLEEEQAGAVRASDRS